MRRTEKPCSVETTVLGTMTPFSRDGHKLNFAAVRDNVAVGIELSCLPNRKPATDNKGEKALLL